MTTRDDERVVTSGDGAAWTEFAAQYPFPLDPFQEQAIAELAADRSVLVAAPTGSGKTLVAEFAIWHAWQSGGRVMYTTPIKALSNQKYADLRARYGEAVGLLTGDISENHAARIIVMTTEILRNMMMQTPWELSDVRAVVFDEIHYLADPERGTTWEESIILCPETIQLVCLSATVSNADEIADWISRTHRPITLITHYERAVPLSLFYFLDQRLVLARDSAGRLVNDLGAIGGEARRRLGERGRGRRSLTPAPNERPEPSPADIVAALERQELLPAIYFLFSRRDCEAAADLVGLMRRQLIRDPVRRQRIDAVLARHLAPLASRDLQLGQVAAISRLARRGIGFHHAGLLPPLKRLVEDLFTQGLMGVVFATDTLALGVNMPARTVVVGRMDKYDGVQRRLLLPNEFQQMAGRAGRRGLDAEGFVTIPYSPWISFKDSLAIATGPLLPVLSAFTIRYNSVLNLWDAPRGSRVRLLLQKSLHAYQSDSRVRDGERELLRLQAEIDDLPRGCLIGLPAGDDLLADYEALGRSLATARDLARRLEAEREQLLRERERPPWTPPTTEALRRALRNLPPGTPVHHRQAGWGLYLGPVANSGRLILFGRQVVPLDDPRQLDYLPAPGTLVALPAALRDVSGPLEDVTTQLTADELVALAEAVAALELPDLAGWQRQFRQQREGELAGAFARVERGLAEARPRIDALVASRDAHACEACPVRKQHQRTIHQRATLERDYTQASERLQRQIRREQERVDRVVGGIAAVLHAFAYLDQGQPTAKAAMLANVFDSNGLILCEAIERGWLAELEADDLAEVCSWFAFDRDTKFGNRYSLPNQLLYLREDLEQLQWQVIGHERRQELEISTGFNRLFYGAARAWCRGADLVAIAEQIELNEGDLVTTLNKTLDLMRQLRDMLKTVGAHPDLRDRLEWAITLIRRDIVEQSYRLGFLLDPATSGEPSETEPAEAEPATADLGAASTPEALAAATLADPALDEEVPPGRARRRRRRATADEVGADGAGG